MAARSGLTDELSIHVRSTDTNLSDKMVKESDSIKNLVEESSKSHDNCKHQVADGMLPSIEVKNDNDEEEKVYVVADECIELNKQTSIQKKETYHCNDEVNEECKYTEISNMIEDKAVLSFCNNSESIVGESLPAVPSCISRNRFSERLRKKYVEANNRRTKRMKVKTTDELSVHVKSAGENPHNEVKDSSAVKNLEQNSDPILKDGCDNLDRQTVAGKLLSSFVANYDNDQVSTSIDKSDCYYDGESLECENTVNDKPILGMSGNNGNNFECTVSTKNSERNCVQSLNGKCMAIRMPCMSSGCTKRLKVESTSKVSGYVKSDENFDNDAVEGTDGIEEVNSVAVSLVSDKSVDDNINNGDKDMEGKLNVNLKFCNKPGYGSLSLSVEVNDNKEKMIDLGKISNDCKVFNKIDFFEVKKTDESGDNTPVETGCRNIDFDNIIDSKAMLSNNNISQSTFVEGTLFMHIKKSRSSPNQNLKRKLTDISASCVSSKHSEIKGVEPTNDLANVKSADEETLKECDTIKDMDRHSNDVQSDYCNNQTIVDNSSPSLAVKNDLIEGKDMSSDRGTTGDRGSNDVNFLQNEKIDCLNDEVISDKSMKLEYDNELMNNAVDKTMLNISNSKSRFGERTPSVLSEKRKSNISRRMRSKYIATSTPCTSNRRPRRSLLVDSAYKPPARSVIEKWKPSLLLDGEKHDCSLQMSSSEIGNISVIDNLGDNVLVKSAITPSHSPDHKSNHNNDFESAFESLYVTLFSCGNVDDGKSPKADQEGNPNSSNISKLELYRDNIVQLHKRDNEKLDEIISEISSLSNQHFITIDEINCDRSAHDLSVITEDELEVNDEKTVVCINEQAVDETLCDVKQIVKAGEEGKSDETSLYEDSDEDNTLKDECDKDKGIEGIEVPVINGSNSIVYLNTKELTLDEENALLNSGDEDDAISLVCSDITDLTPSSSVANLAENTKVVQQHSDAELIADKPEHRGVDSAAISGVCGVTSDLMKDFLKDTVAVPPADDRNLPFISSDPKENEDNNDPEWEHLRRLKNDKDRYRALRERWHSVIIPDPNLDLTSQTYRRKKVKESEGGVSSLNSGETKTNNNGGNKNPKKRTRSPSKFQDLDREPARKKRKCTTLFEQNIQNLVKRLEFKRYCLYQEMNKTFADLACRQEDAVLKCQMINASRYIQMKCLKELHSYQLEEVDNVRRMYTAKLAEAEQQMQEYVEGLNAASEEVNTFHKFYQDLNATDHSVGSMYLTDTQFQELVETENMLELYNKFYN